MYDDSDEIIERDFWSDDEPTRSLRRLRNDEPTRSLRRLSDDETRPLRRTDVGRRSHGRVDRTELIPIVLSAAARSAGSRPMARPTVSPLVLRLGALVAAATVMIPVAASLGKESGSGSATAATSPPPTALVGALPTPTAGVVTSLVVLGAAPIDPAITPTTVPVASATPSPSAPQPAVQTRPGVQAQPAVQARPVTEAVPAAAPVPTVAAQPAVQARPVTEALPAAAPVPTVVAQPRVAEKAACANTYTIVAGDYWILIATKVSVTFKELLAANGANPKTALYSGKTICLPKNASAPTQIVAATPTSVAITTTGDSAPAPKPTQAARATPVPVPAPKPTTPAPKPTTPPTTAPKPVPTTTDPPPKNSYSRVEVEQIIRDVWPDDLEDEAVRIATRESDLTPTVRNYCCYGLFQIYYSQHSGWINAMGVYNASGLFDPRINALAALVLYQRSGGWGPWKL